MVLVLLVLGVLFGIAVPRYQAQILKAKEAVLEHNLAVLRERLDQYRADRDEFPPNLADLVVAGYLRTVPEDPMTQSILWEEVRDGYDPMFPDAPAGGLRCAEPLRRRSAATAAPTVSGDRRGGGSAGYVLFGVLIGVAVLGVGMMAGVSLWSRVVQREREAELVFRGEAIVRALERYQQDRPGTLPQTLEELVERRYLRRAWLDPMTRSPFRLLRAETAAGAPGSPGSDTRAGMIPNPAAGEYEEEAARPAPEAVGEAEPGIVGWRAPATSSASASTTAAAATATGGSRPRRRAPAAAPPAGGNGPDARSRDEKRIPDPSAGPRRRPAAGSVTPETGRPVPPEVSGGSRGGSGRCTRRGGAPPAAPRREAGGGRRSRTPPRCLRGGRFRTAGRSRRSPMARESS